MKKLLLLLVAVMVLTVYPGGLVLAETGIDISCVDGEIVVSGSFDGGDVVGETYNVEIETYDEDGTTLLKTDTAEEATVVAGENTFSFAADIVANVQPIKVYIKTSNGTTVATAEETIRSLKVLAIGNSFSVDAMQWMYGIANDLGVDNIVLGNAYYSGCSLQQHMGFAEENSASYSYRKNTEGTWTTTESQTLLDCINDENWNLITVQQVSQYSGMTSTFEPYLTNLVEYVNENKTNPYAKIAWHMTWAYAQESSHSGFANYNYSQKKMYEAIASAGEAVGARDDIDFIIPSGTAIQNARTSPVIGDTLNRDGYHLDYGIGRYTAGLAWVHKITGLAIDNLTYVPNDVGTGTSIYNLQLAALIESVKNAVNKPYEITAFEAEEETEEGVYFSDDFSADGNKGVQAAVALSGKWAVGQSYSTSIPVYYSIDDGFLAMSYRWQKAAAKVYPTDDKLSSLPAENEISYKMAHFNGYPGESGAYYGTANWTQQSTVYSRFNVSEDGNSYFEIGHSGYGTALNNYPLPKSGDDGVPETDTEGNVVYAKSTDNDYKFRFYIRKVVDGVTTYIKWENDADGWNNQTYSDRLYRMIMRTMVSYESDTEDSILSLDSWFTVNIKNTATGVEYSVSATKLGSGAEYTWSGSIADTSLSRVGADFYFGCMGHEAGAVVDDVKVLAETEENPDGGTTDGSTIISKTEVMATDDFESYAALASIEDGTSKNTYVAGESWFASSADYFGSNKGTELAGVVQDPATTTKNNVLAIEGYAVASRYVARSRIIYQDYKATVADKHTYKFDFYKGNNTTFAGVVFNFAGSNSSKLTTTEHYALEFAGRGDHAWGYSGTSSGDNVYSTALIKNSSRVEDAVINTTPETTTTNRVNNDYIPVAAWYTAEIAIDGGVISWTVKDTSGTTVQTGSWTDSAPLASDLTSVALYAGGDGGAIAYFDNFSITKTTETIVEGGDSGENDDDNTGSDDGIMNTVVSENFEAYDTISSVSSNGYGRGTYVTKIDGTDATGWLASSADYFGSSNKARAGVVQDPSTATANKVLGIYPYAALRNNWNYRARVIYQNYNASKYNKHIYKFDFYKSSGVAQAGIVFNFAGDETTKLNNTDYYAIEFAGQGDHSAYGYDGSSTGDNVYSTVLMKSGSRQADAVINTNPETTTTNRVNHDYIPAGAWYTAEITVDGGAISWTVTKVSTNEIVQTGSWTDPNPIEKELTSFALFAGGDGTGVAYFDNVSVKKSSAAKPNYQTKGNELTVEFSPAAIDGIESMNKLQVIAAYYDYETNALEGVDVREITDLSIDVCEKFILTDEYDYAKIFIWNGEVAEAIPAHKPLDIERKGKYIITDVTDIGDPQILYHDGVYYMYCTYNPTYGYYVRTSADLINWSEPVMCYDKTESNAWGQGRFWAPEVTYHNGKFIMHYSATKTYGNSVYRIGVATSDSPMGPFTDVHGEPMFDYGYSAIDASVFIDKDNDKYYLYYSKDLSSNVDATTGTGYSQTYCVEVDSTLTNVIGEPQLMITPEYDFELISVSQQNNAWNEGPTVIKYKDKYIMNYSANYYKTNDYAICIAQADNPMGPWTKIEANNPVLSKNNDAFGAGHNTFFTGADGKLYTSFHIQTYPDNPGDDRRLAIGRVLFEEDADGNIKQKIIGATYREDIDIVASRVDAVGSTTILDLFKTSQSTWADNANNSTTTAFIGDSYFNKSFWTDFSTTYSGKDVSLIGVSSSRTSDWTDCVDEVFGNISPKNVVIHLGTNDFYDKSETVSNVVGNVKALCETIHELYPDAKIYYFAITQRVNTTYADRVTGTNSALKTWCSTTDYATFVDTTETITTDMLKDDGVHMTSEGYTEFVNALENAGCEISNK